MGDKQKTAIFVEKYRIMAITIKTIPVLEGQAAVEFVEQAERNARLKTPKLSEKSRLRLHAVLEKSRRFKFQS